MMLFLTGLKYTYIREKIIKQTKKPNTEHIYNL